MNEININFNLDSPQEKNKKILIYLDSIPEDELLFKFFVGCNGIWSTLKDFDVHSNIEWLPKEDGKYIIMVQAKNKNSSKSFDYVSRRSFIIGKVEENLIGDVKANKDKLTVGEKINISVESNKDEVLYRYWIKEKENWELIKDYSAENKITWSAKIAGIHDVLVECKNIESENAFDDFKQISFEVVPVKKVEINEFECLTEDLVVGSELIFQVNGSLETDRIILYKFVKIDSNGSIFCIQDYSTKRMVNYVEEKSGEYKLLCMCRDMYSPDEYDDRAVINFKVKKYKEIQIQSFTTDLSSPQICESNITLKAVANGGKELLYRYIVDGNYGEDSGYIRSNSYEWNPKVSGEYKVTLWVKDASCSESYEKCKSIDFSIDDKSNDPVIIEEIIVDKKNKILKNESVRINVKAKGGIDLKYSFVVRKDNKVKEVVEYGSCNWTNFIPKEEGKFEIEVKVKDKYSMRNYDCHEMIYVEACEYFAANIDYVLYPVSEYFMCEDNIEIDVIAENTKNMLIKYVLKINEHKVEESDFGRNTIYGFKPKVSGTYSVEIYAKNKDSKKQFDCKKDVEIIVHEALPVTNTKIKCNKTKMVCNEPIIFTAESEGGKDVVYEFYIMENGEWNKVQGYSKKNYYSYIPFVEGTYKVLVLTKSQYKKSSYEDYDMLQFNVEQLVVKS